MNVIPGGGLRTYDEKGVKQVALHGKTEKRGFTAVLGISADGFLLGTQAVWKEKTDALLPSADLEEAALQDIGLTFVSNSRNHWSSLKTME